MLHDVTFHGNHSNMVYPLGIAPQWCSDQTNLLMKVTSRKIVVHSYQTISPMTKQIAYQQ